MNLHFSRISISNYRSSLGIIIEFRYEKRNEGWHTPHVSKSLRREQEGLKTNVRDDRSEFYDFDGWGMYELSLRGENPPPDPFQSVLSFYSVLLTPLPATI